MEGKRLANFTPPQFIEYGLEPLLDQLPDNEQKLIATREVWQIAAFADLYAEKLIKGLPKRTDYERAKRLYQACLDDQHIDDAYFRKKLADLERVWKGKGE